jgi:peptidyl-dipeptidase Dcp
MSTTTVDITSPAAALDPSNPFADPSTLPYQAPPFDRIKDEHYLPAIEAGMAQQRTEIDAIASNPEPASFENTLVAMERSGSLLHRVLSVFGAITGANTNPTLQEIKTTIAPRLAAHSDSITLNDALFQRVAILYTQREALNLDPESRRLLEITYDGFVHAGAGLDETGKTRLKQLNEESSTLSTAFINKILAAAKESLFITKDPSALAGLSEAQLAAAAELAKSRNLEGWALPIQNTTQQDFFDVLTNRETRRVLFELSWRRTEPGTPNDTTPIITRLAQIRAERATLLGFPTYAAWKLQDQMAKTQQNAQEFLTKLVTKATGLITAEAAEIQSLINEQNPTNSFELQPWDWPYYAEQVRKAKYALDEELIKPYFELSSVLERGVLYAATQLFGITFTERHDLPVYHPTVRVFELRDTDGAPLSLFYFDPFKRDNKNGGAWMSSLVHQSRLIGTLPVIYNVCNYPQPAEGQPALLTLDQVTTLFHEFGHALHGLFSTAMYPSLSGTAVARDFVEFPSQFNEYWATYPAVFTNYARHHATGEPMPAELAEKVRHTKDFNKGYRLTEVLASSIIDMQWHTLPPDAPLQNPDTIETEALTSAGLKLSYVPPRYRSSYFAHIWGGGYAAGYYAYQWAETLEDRAIEWFETHDGLTRPNGGRLRNMVLSRGNTEDLAQMFENWISDDSQAN